MIKYVLRSLAKNDLLPLGVTATGSATDAAIQKKIFGSGTMQVNSNEEIYSIVKIYKSLKDTGLLIKWCS